MGTTREALEAALEAEPESVALHSAYADLLIEEGDPRGEYIRLELMLEEEALVIGGREMLARNRLERVLGDVAIAIEQRANLLKNRDQLRANHEAEWLGRLQKTVPHILNSTERGIYSFRGDPLAIYWKRGWIEEAFIHVVHAKCVSMIAQHPFGKLLRECSLYDYRSTLTFGDLSRIFEYLDSLPLRQLTLISSRTAGDQVVELLNRRALLTRLTSLTIMGCGITDDGAISLAESSSIRKLKSLNLDNNFLSPIGIAALAEVGFEVGPQRDNPAWDGGADAD